MRRLLGLILLFLCSTALAQNIYPFSATASTVSITAPNGSSSAATTLPGNTFTGNTVQVYNAGSVAATIAFSDGANASAASNSLPVGAGQTLYYSISPLTSTVAAYGVGGTPNVSFTRGNGGAIQQITVNTGGGGSGITQLTGDVTAGPGTGSQVATVVKINGGAPPTSANVGGWNSSGQPVAATAAQILTTINSQTCNAQTGTTYTYALGDANNCVTGSNAAAQTYTVPPNSSVAFAVGTTITTTQIGAGTITIGPGSGVTLQSAKYGSSTSQTYAFAAEYSCISLQKTATDTWFVSSCDYNPGSGSGVSSFTGDGALLSNSGSTGGVTATLANAAANSLWGNTSGSSGAPGYHAVNATALAVLLDTTAITVSGCTPSASSLAPTTGGTITQPATPCTTATFTFNGGTAITGVHGWNCTMGDVTQTNAGTYIPTWVQSSSTTTTCVMKIPAAAQVASDVLAVHTSWY